MADPTPTTPQTEESKKRLREKVDFVLADGTSLTRKVSECVFELEGVQLAPLPAIEILL